jgi:meso-butanediol dehydrogenase/(S,S)-butanediol dehydrogenase/diacetyl reductase
MSEVSPSVEGSRVIISGGTSGIGAATARLLAERGASVWILGSRDETVHSAMSGSPGLAGGTACDVSDAGAVAVAFKTAVSEMGGIDGAFANAGIDGVGKSCLEIPADAFLKVLDVNVVGTFNVAKEAALAMSGHPGAIVLNASVNGLRAERFFADYNASKAAVVSLTHTMAIELAPVGIVVTSICPGYIPTRMTAQYLDDEKTARELLEDIPAKRFGKPQEVAELVCFLLSSAASYMAGAVVSIDGGRNV